MALAVNTLEGVEGAQSSAGATYPFLADPEHQVAEAYGIYNLLGDGVAAPAVFVISSDGSILWSYVGAAGEDRPPVADILAHLP